MIIQCKQCATKFRFSDELMTGDGVWVRCGRCGHEFFEINTKRETFVPPREPAPAMREAPPAPGGEGPPPAEKAAPKPAAVEEPAALPRPLTPADVTRPPTAPKAALEEDGLPEEDLEEETPRASFWTPSRIVVYSILVVLVVIGVYLWLFPQIGRDALNFVSPGSGDRVMGAAPKAAAVAAPGGINFAEVKERFTKSTASGDLLVISGLAVNEFEYPVARVRLRGKILDSAGKVLGEIETFAGNLLTDEELNRLTDKEVLAELQRQEGSDMPNANIRSRASIPFMIVFSNPPKEVDEFIIELSGVERSAASN
jgi:predicted Zn finger-like uncharacterized protein